VSKAREFQVVHTKTDNIVRVTQAYAYGILDQISNVT